MIDKELTLIHMDGRIAAFPHMNHLAKKCQKCTGKKLKVYLTGSRD